MKNLSIAHDYNDPIEIVSDDASLIREKIAMYCTKYEGKRVFLFGDGGSFFDEKAYPVNRLFIHEDLCEILRFFDAMQSSTIPQKQIDGDDYIQVYFLQMYKSYQEAFDVAKDIITECSTSKMRYEKET